MDSLPGASNSESSPFKVPLYDWLSMRRLDGAPHRRSLPNKCFLPTNGPAGLSRFARLAAEAQDVRRLAGTNWLPYCLFVFYLAAGSTRPPVSDNWIAGSLISLPEPGE